MMADMMQVRIATGQAINLVFQNMDMGSRGIDDFKLLLKSHRDMVHAMTRFILDCQADSLTLIPEYQQNEQDALNGRLNM